MELTPKKIQPSFNPLSLNRPPFFLGLLNTNLKPSLPKPNEQRANKVTTNIELYPQIFFERIKTVRAVKHRDIRKRTMPTKISRPRPDDFS